VKLFAVGVNHTTAPVELREQLAIPDERIGEDLPGLVRSAGLDEAMVLSTCNRVEIYGVGGSQDPRRVVNALADLRGVNGLDFEDHCFVAGQRSAARHIFRVAASLESMVVGEPQILGQVKDAYQAARDVGTVGAVLDRCLTMAFRGAKRVRTETAIARGAASVPSVAVDLAVSIFGSLAGRRVLLLGAGEMSEQAGIHMRSAGANEIVVVNRTQARGRALAEAVEGRNVAWEQLGTELEQVDVVVTSTGSPQPVIGPRLMKDVMRARRGAPVFMVDIAVPRDIDPAVAEVEQVFLYNVDDLQDIVHENMESRAAQAELASRVVDEEVMAFIEWGRARAAAPVLEQLQAHASGIVADETQKALQKLNVLPDAQRKVVETLAHQVARKLIHRPMSAVREAASGDERSSQELAGALAQLFQLSTRPADEAAKVQDKTGEDTDGSVGDE
jgi:glutamyl-tRNA reductase